MKDAKYREVLKDNASLAVFIRNMARFDKYFCELMASGVDFNLHMDIRGNKGELLQCKVQPVSFDRPPGVEKRIEEQKRGKS